MYQKLISAIELYGMSVTFIPFDALAEFILGDIRASEKVLHSYALSHILVEYLHI